MVTLELFLIQFNKGRCEYRRFAKAFRNLKETPDDEAKQMLLGKYSRLDPFVRKDQYVLHSTSWRYEKGFIVTYVAVVDQYRIKLRDSVRL